MTLTVKQRAKVNAALCIINDHGHNAQAVANAAHAIMATGQPPQHAYAKAINDIGSNYPDMARAMGSMTRLIEASSPATVAQYDQALSRYIATGDDSAMIALAPTIAKDSIALAIHNGEMTQADVANGGLGKALGFEPSATLQQAYEGQTTPSNDQPQDAEFNTMMNTQVSPVEGAGFVAPKAQAKHAHYSGFVPDAPALHGLTPAAAREAARASAAGRSHFIIEADSNG